MQPAPSSKYVALDLITMRTYQHNKIRCFTIDTELLDPSGGLKSEVGVGNHGDVDLSFRANDVLVKHM